MKSFVALLMLSAFFVGCKDNKKEKPETPAIITNRDAKLITDSSWGMIDRDADIAALQKLFGQAAIKDERICGAECMDSVDVTTVFPGTENEFTIYWLDSAYHKKISRIEAYSPNSPYHSDKGIRIGTTMKELLALNGQPIVFSGFDWDYGGFISSFNGGKLDRSPINMRLYPDSTIGEGLSGDSELNTDQPVVKKALDKIKVSELYLSFSE